MKQLQRTELLLGQEAMETLMHSHIAVFGLGGVGGFAVEAIARCGVGHIDIIDKDIVDITNLNRQIIATRSTIGQSKTEVMKNRIHDINPNITVRTFPLFFLPDTKDQFDFTQYDYVVDAVDTVTAKLELITQAKAAGTPIICSMGAGNKLDPTRFEVADISQTSVCPLARVMRQECKKRGLTGVKVVYSKEKPVVSHPSTGSTTAATGGKPVPASCAFVPSVAGLIIASEVIKDLTLF